MSNFSLLDQVHKREKQERDGGEALLTVINDVVVSLGRGDDAPEEVRRPEGSADCFRSVYSLQHTNILQNAKKRGKAVSYNDLVKSNADETDIRSYLAEGKQVAVTFRIPENLRDSAKEAAELRGMSFSAFMRMCMMSELSKPNQ